MVTPVDEHRYCVMLQVLIYEFPYLTMDVIKSAIDTMGLSIMKCCAYLSKVMETEKEATYKVQRFATNTPKPEGVIECIDLSDADSELSIRECYEKNEGGPKYISVIKPQFLLHNPEREASRLQIEKYNLVLKTPARNTNSPVPGTSKMPDNVNEIVENKPEYKYVPLAARRFKGVSQESKIHKGKSLFKHTKAPLCPTVITFSSDSD